MGLLKLHLRMRILNLQLLKVMTLILLKTSNKEKYMVSLILIVGTQILLKAYMLKFKSINVIRGLDENHPNL
jgi:hypothetical protein